MAGLRAARRRHDRGASAVEFALVAPLLFVILFGIIDYGIWFSDSISARQAVRDNARRGVVEDFGPGCSATGADKDLHNLSCSVVSSMGQISGSTVVRVSVVKGPGDNTSVPWAAGATLRVCAMTQHTSLLPFVPFPNSGISVTRVDMPIESAVSTAHGQLYEPGALPPGDWPSWCP